MKGLVLALLALIPSPSLLLLLTRLSMKDFELSTDDFKAVHLPNLQTLKLRNCGKVCGFCSMQLCT